MHRVITDTAALAAFCARVASEPFLTVDTEFLREKTYWPQLCLVQVGGEHEAVAIDPLAKGIDLTPLFDLMHDENVLKVMHSGRQDMEIFYHLMGEVPLPVFDTQIAAQVIGLGESIGYEALVNKLLNLPVDKSQRFTDWSHRPLTQAQVEYALGDVTHLREAYLKMRAEIDQRGRLGWIAEEMEALHEASLYEGEPEEAYKRIKFRGAGGKQLGRLKVMATWRERLAQQEDIPRVRIIRDDALADLAVNLPKDEEALKRVRGFPQHFKREWKESFWVAVDKALNLPKEEWPEKARGEPWQRGGEEAMELLRLLLKLCAQEAQVTPRLLADKEELEAFVRGEREGLHMLRGWRAECFGAKAEALMAGRLSFGFDPKKRDIVWVEAA